MPTKIVVEIGCEPGAKSCGECHLFWSDAMLGYYMCEAFSLALGSMRDYTSHEVPRAQACLDAEKKAGS